MITIMIVVLHLPFLLRVEHLADLFATCKSRFTIWYKNSQKIETNERKVRMKRAKLTKVFCIASGIQHVV